MAVRSIIIKRSAETKTKIVGSVPSENNFTDALKLKLETMSGGELTTEQLNYIVSQIPPTDLSNYVAKETGKGLSANDYTNEEREKLTGITGGLTQSQILIRQL